MILVNPLTGRILLQPGDVLMDGQRVLDITLDGLGQTVVFVEGGQRPQPSNVGRRFNIGGKQA